MKQSVELKFQGQRITLKTENDPETVKEVIALVTRKLQLAEKRLKSAPVQQIQLIALLELAEEYIKAKKRTVDYKKRMNDKLSSLLTTLEGSQ